MKNLRMSGCLTLAALLTTIVVAAEKKPQQLTISPLQRVLNGSRTALIKDNFYLGFPVPEPMPTPPLCDLGLKFGARFTNWEEGIPIGRFEHVPWGGSSLGAGKIVPVGLRNAYIDLEDDGPDEDDPSLEVLDELSIRLTNFEALGDTLTPGCFDFVLWSGFEILNPNRVDFCMWGDPQSVPDVHAFRTAGPWVTIPAIFNFAAGDLQVMTELSISNAGHKEVEGFMDFFNGTNGQGTNPFSSHFSVAAGATRKYRFPDLGNLPVVGRLFSERSQKDLKLSSAFITLLKPTIVDKAERSPSGAEEEILGAAGLASPRLAGMHVLGVSRNSSGADTGVLISNPTNHDGNLILTLLDDEETPVAETVRPLAARHVVSQFFLEYFGLEPVGELQDFEGTLQISGDVPTSVVTLGTQDGFQQFSLPAAGGQIGAP